MDIDRVAASIVLTVITITYVATGRQGWRCLATAAETPEQVAFIIGAHGPSVWMQLGRHLMVVTWPLWWFTPAVIGVVRRNVRFQA